MKVGLSGSGVVALAGLGLLAAVGIWLYFKGPAILKKTVTETLNPASDQNIVNQGVTGVVSAATGREESLGGAIADMVFNMTHPDFSFTAPVNLANPVAPPAARELASSNPAPVSSGPTPGEIAAWNAAQPPMSLTRMLPGGLIVY